MRGHRTRVSARAWEGRAVLRRFVVPLLAGMLLFACGADDPGADPGDAAVGEETFDRSRSEEEARALLGLPEDRVEEGPATRIVRRGDVEYPATLDLQPGRRNVEVDDDSSGTYVVTRVVVEVPGGEDPLVVE